MGNDYILAKEFIKVAGLIKDLVMSIFLLPTLYVWAAGDRDVLPRAEEGFEVGEHVD